MTATRDKQRQGRDRPETDQIEVEPGADKRLANILKKALNTPPVRKATGASAERPKGRKARAER